MKRYQTPESAALPPHTHAWVFTDVALTGWGEEAVYTCHQPLADGTPCHDIRRELRIDDDERQELTDLEFLAEINSPANMWRGFLIGVAFIAALSAIAWIVTGRFWPI